MMKIRLFMLAAPLAMSALPAFASLGSGYTLFGGATYVMPGDASNRAVQLVANISDSDPSNDSSGVDFAVPSGMTFADLQTLGLDYRFTSGSCTGGSPRFQINVIDPNTNTVKNIFVYIGPPPTYTGCAANTWTTTGNLVAPSSLIDTSQLTAGNFYDPEATAQSKYGTYTVVGIQVVSDTFGAAQTVQVDNVVINTAIYTFEPDSKDSCKNGGWQNFTSAPGPFKNEGQCVSSFASNGHGL